ncbi:MAG: hypothetical protein ABRQ23_03960 [Syntrophomonadaceae bacterium]
MEERGANVTAEESRKKTQGQEEMQKQMLDFTEAWKKLYFETESAFAKAVEEYVSTDSFSDILQDFGKQYLAMYKSTSQNIDRFFDNHPLPTKKDIARICELVVDVEEKVDQLESDFNTNMAGLASSLIRLVDFQVALKDEMLAIRKEMLSLQKNLVQMQGKAAAEMVKTLPVDKAGGAINPAKEPIADAAEPPAAVRPQAARPRVRAAQPKGKK